MFYKIQKCISILLLMFILSGQALACSTGDTPDNDKVSKQTIKEALMIKFKQMIRRAPEDFKNRVGKGPKGYGGVRG